MLKISEKNRTNDYYIKAKKNPKTTIKNAVMNFQWNKSLLKICKSFFVKNFKAEKYGFLSVLTYFLKLFLMYFFIIIISYSNFLKIFWGLYDDFLNQIYIFFFVCDWLYSGERLKIFYLWVEELLKSLFKDLINWKNSILFRFFFVLWEF